MKKLLTLVALGAVVLLSGCAKQQPYDYSAFRASKPTSILVLPAKNSTPNVNAAHSLVSVVTQPLAESGYYVFPVALVDKTFKQNGLSNAADAQTVSTAKLYEIFHADAALYIDVTDYGTRYRVVDSITQVTAQARLVDLRTGKQIWAGSGTASDAQNDNNGVLGMLISAAIKQVASNMTDKSHDIAVLTANAMLNADGRNGSILAGPRAPQKAL